FALFRAPAPTGIYPLSLHDALPISGAKREACGNIPGVALGGALQVWRTVLVGKAAAIDIIPALHEIADIAMHPQAGFGAGYIERSEEHTSELQSREKLVCRLLLEKK